MNRTSTLFLRGVIIIMALGVLALCIFVLPAGLEGGGMYSPIVIGMYIAAIPFYIALYQAYKLLNLIDKNNAFSELAVKALKNIKYCGIAIGALYFLGLPYIFRVADKDDAPGVLAIALVIVGASFVIAVFAAVLQKLLQNVVAIKKENELTV
jgi:hypothetical protein